jgi:hypothetical protein
MITVLLIGPDTIVYVPVHPLSFNWAKIREITFSSDATTSLFPMSRDYRSLIVKFKGFFLILSISR